MLVSCFGAIAHRHQRRPIGLCGCGRILLWWSPVAMDELSTQTAVHDVPMAVSELEGGTAVNYLPVAVGEFST